MTEPKDGGSPPAEQAAPGASRAEPAARPGPSAPLTGAAALGHAVWVMMNIPAYRHLFLTDLEWMVMPPILHRQFSFFEAEGRIVAFAAWAYVSEEVEKRLEQPGARLGPGEWKSGDRLWLIELFAPFGHGEMALKELQEKALAGKVFRMLTRNAPSEERQT